MAFLYYDLTGGLDSVTSKIVLGLQNKNIASSVATNIEIYNNKGITRQKGNKVFLQLENNSTVTGLFELIHKNIKYLLINTLEGNFYVYNNYSKTLTKLKSSLSPTKTVSYAKFLDGVCISNGVDEPFFFDPTDQNEQIKSCNATSSNGEEVRGLAIASYKGRLWIAHGGTLYFSSLGRYDDWQSDDAGYISNFHSDYGEITALCPYMEYLAIYKKDQTYLLSGSSTSDFEVQNFANIGVCSNNSVVTINNKQYLYSEGVFNLSQVGMLGQIGISSDLSSNIKTLLQNSDKYRPEKTLLIPYTQKNQIWFFIPQNNVEYLHVVWIYDYFNQSWFKREIPQNIVCAGTFNEKPITATIDGKILIEDMGNSFCSEPINFMWKSPYFSFNAPHNRKLINEFFLVLDDYHDNDFKFSTFQNFDDYTEYDLVDIHTSNPKNIIWDDNNCKWGDNQNDLSEDLTGMCWAKAIETTQRTLISHANNNVQICIKGNSQTQNFCIIGLEFRDIDIY